MTVFSDQPNRLPQAPLRLLELVRAGIGTGAPDVRSFEGLDAAAWQELLDLSIRQGVIALAYDGAMTLPAGLHPPKQVRLPWALHVESVERRSQHQAEVAGEIARLLAAENIPALQFKGASLARFYPTPSHRESGDIDLYLFGHAARAEQLLLQAGATKYEMSHERHLIVVYKGVPIELHHHFIDEDKSESRELEQNLQEFAQGIYGEPPAGKFLLPPPDFDALFVMIHTMGHFIRLEIVLRQLCDLACLWKACGSEIDRNAYVERFERAGYAPLSDALTALCVRYLGLAPDQAPSHAENRPLEERILHELFFPVARKNCNSWIGIIQYKFLRLKGLAWRYRLAGHNYPRRVWKAALRFFRHPIAAAKL